VTWGERLNSPRVRIAAVALSFGSLCLIKAEVDTTHNTGANRSVAVSAAGKPRHKDASNRTIPGYSPTTTTLLPYQKTYVLPPTVSFPSITPESPAKLASLRNEVAQSLPADNIYRLPLVSSGDEKQFPATLFIVDNETDCAAVTKLNFIDQGHKVEAITVIAARPSDLENVSNENVYNGPFVPGGDTDSALVGAPLFVEADNNAAAIDKSLGELTVHECNDLPKS